MVGGRAASDEGGMTYLNDVWRSSDGGASWTKVRSAADFAPRAHFGSATHGRMILVVGGATEAPVLRLNDVWASKDGGLTWTRVTAAAAFGARYGMACLKHASLHPAVALRRQTASNVFSLRSQILVMGGSTCEAGCTRYDTSLAGCRTLAGAPPAHCCLANETCLHRVNLADVWSSDDLGGSWARAGSTPLWKARTFAMSNSQVDSSLLLAGGYDSWDRYFGDVWRSEDGGASWRLVLGNSSAYSASASGPTSSSEGSKSAASRWAPRSLGHIDVLGSCPVLLGGHRRSGAADYQHFHDVWVPSPGV